MRIIFSYPLIRTSKFRSWDVSFKDFCLLGFSLWFFPLGVRAFYLCISESLVAGWCMVWGKGLMV